MPAEANSELHQAIEHAARLTGVIKEGEFIGDWALVVNIQSFELTEQDRVAYGHMYKDGSLMDHVALGLYQMGVHLVMSGNEVDRD